MSPPAHPRDFGHSHGLPQWSASKRTTPFPIQARFVVAYETALRPSTLSDLRVPEHYSRGSATLTLTDELDKARFGRDLPLSPEARRALDAVCPESGPIFGKHDYRDALGKAAATILPPAKAEKFCAYDLRHARLTQLAEHNVNGAAYLAGHRRVSTTALYVKPNRRAAERVLAAVGDTGFRNPTNPPDRLVGFPNSTAQGTAPIPTSRSDYTPTARRMPPSDVLSDLASRRETLPPRRPPQTKNSRQSGCYSAGLEPAQTNPAKDSNRPNKCQEDSNKARVRPHSDCHRGEQRLLEPISAKKRTRTSTGVTPLAPQAVPGWLRSHIPGS